MKPFAYWQRFVFVVVYSLMLNIVAAGTLARAADETPDSITSAAPITAQQDFQLQVSALIAAYPDGGPDLEAELGALVAAQPDGAFAIATLMVAIGTTPSAALLIAVSNAMLSATDFTPEQLEAAVTTAVASAPDPVVAAAGVVSCAATLPPALQVAAGSGLAKASAALTTAGNAEAAASIAATAVGSQIAALSQSFNSTAAAIAGPATTQSTKVTTVTKPPEDSVPEKTGSPS